MVATMKASRLSSQICEPRYATRRRPERKTFGHRLAKIAKMLGTPFMPWQRLVADVGCELLPNGQPAYSEVVLTTPRQSGKTVLLFTWQLDRCVLWGRPQRSAFTAQTGKDARDKWLDELYPLLKASPLHGFIEDMNRGMGNEAITFKTGSILRLLSTSSASGHSKTLDQAVMDEIWHDVDDRREQGLRPAMVTRADRQLLVCSTAGTSSSLVYNRKVQVGRRSVLEDSGQGVAYFEWSAPDDWDPEDQESWWGFMPALGFTIRPDVIEQERLAMQPDEFRRAYGNRPTRGVNRIIPIEAWTRVCDESVKPADPIRFGLAVAEDRGSAAIVAADASGALELVDHRPGIGWVPDRINDLTQRYSTMVRIDEGGPEGALGDLHRCERLKSREVLTACAGMYDAIIEAKVKFRTDPAFDEAVGGAAKKPVGDLWAWSRKASVGDVTPLMAATLALRAAKPEAVVRVMNLSDIPDEDEE